MPTLFEINDEDVQCSECDVIFMVVFHRNAWTTHIEYCPFCGGEIDYNDKN